MVINNPPGVNTRPSGVAKPQYLYAAQSNVFPALFKIGRAINPQTRISNGNTFSRPSPFSLVAQVETMDYIRDEKKVHDRFAANRQEGEFFKVSLEDITKAFASIKETFERESVVMAVAWQSKEKITKRTREEYEEQQDISEFPSFLSTMEDALYMEKSTLNALVVFQCDQGKNDKFSINEYNCSFKIESCKYDAHRLMRITCSTPTKVRVIMNMCIRMMKCQTGIHLVKLAKEDHYILIGSKEKRLKDHYLYAFMNKASKQPETTGYVGYSILSVSGNSMVQETGKTTLEQEKILFQEQCSKREEQLLKREQQCEEHEKQLLQLLAKFSEQETTETTRHEKIENAKIILRLKLQLLEMGIEPCVE